MKKRHNKKIKRIIENISLEKKIKLGTIILNEILSNKRRYIPIKEQNGNNTQESTSNIGALEPTLPGLSSFGINNTSNQNTNIDNVISNNMTELKNELKTGKQEVEKGIKEFIDRTTNTEIIVSEFIKNSNYTQEDLIRMYKNNSFPEDLIQAISYARNANRDQAIQIIKSEMVKLVPGINTPTILSKTLNMIRSIPTPVKVGALSSLAALGTAYYLYRKSKEREKLEKRRKKEEMERMKYILSQKPLTLRK